MRSLFQYKLFVIIVLSTLFMFSPYAQQTNTEESKSNNICAIPKNTDVIHLPVQIWDDSSERKKIVQETFNTVTKGADDAIQFADDAIRFVEKQWKSIINIESNSDDDYTQEFNEKKQPSIVEEVAYPQFVLARLIQNIPNSFVFHEFLTEIYDARYLDTLKSWETVIQHPEQLPKSENRKPEHLFQLVKRQFKNGLPEQYIDLNDDQKYTLAITGGVHTLFFLGELPVIFPSISGVDFQKVHFPYHNNCEEYYDTLNICDYPNSALRIFREEKLASIVNNFLETFSSKHDKKPVAILVYREGYDLQYLFPGKRFYRMPDSCISIKTE